MCFLFIRVLWYNSSQAVGEDADYIFLLNQDAYIEPSTVEKLVQAHQMVAREHYGILSPVHLNGDGTSLDKAFVSYVSPPLCEDFISDIYLKKERPVIPTRFVNAAAWLITTECIDKVGGFDPIFFHYGEDNNYINRVHYHGFMFGVVPQATIRHDRESPYKGRVDFKSRIKAKNIHLLVKLTDINGSRNINKIIFKELARIVWGIFTLKRDRVIEGYVSARYFISRFRKIQNARNRTSKAGPTYLA